MTRSAFHARSRAARTTLIVAIACAFSLAIAAPSFALDSSANGCSISVTPATASHTVGQQHTVTASITADNPQQLPSTIVEPGWGQTYDACSLGEIDQLAGSTVRFTVTSGPDAGQTADVALDSNGAASFTYTGVAAGTDQIVAEYLMPDMRCDRAQAIQPEECEVVIGAQVSADWTAPVVAEADPSMSITAYKRCVSHKFYLSPSYSGGTLQSSTLFVDGRKTQTNSNTDPFLLNPRHYKAGKHNFEIVSVFTNGKSASKFGSFTRCQARVTRAKVAPKFTG